MAHFAQLTAQGWTEITAADFETGGTADQDSYALAWLEGDILRVASGVDSTVEFEFADEDDRRDTNDEDYDFIADVVETCAAPDSEHKDFIAAAESLACAGVYAGIDAGEKPVDAASQHRSSHLHARALVAQTGLSQTECARRLGIESRTFRSYLMNPATATTARPMPYAVQVALERLADERSDA
jgi:hypothetical protein